MVTHIRAKHLISERRACSLMKLSRTVFHYRRNRANKDTEIEEALARLAGLHLEMGFGKFHTMLRREEKGWNHKRDNLGLLRNEAE